MALALQQSAERFVTWTKRKILHHFNEIEVRKEKYFREKEIWWAALGKNIGFETDGKHELFERPVLILKKYSQEVCFVLPLTSQIKSWRPWYQVLVSIDGENSAVNITQGRSISNKRLLRKMAVLDTVKYNEIVMAFTDQFKKK